MEIKSQFASDSQNCGFAFVDVQFYIALLFLVGVYPDAARSGTLFTSGMTVELIGIRFAGAH
jgi:hypothetical protein